MITAIPTKFAPAFVHWLGKCMRCMRARCLLICTTVKYPLCTCKHVWRTWEECSAPEIFATPSVPRAVSRMLPGLRNACCSAVSPLHANRADAVVEPTSYFVILSYAFQRAGTPHASRASTLQATAAARVLTYTTHPKHTEQLEAYSASAKCFRTLTLGPYVGW